MIFKPYTIPARYRPQPPDANAPVDALGLRWLGTAAFALTAGKTTLLIDPFVSRPGLLKVAFSRLEPAREEIDRYVPRADYVVVGHSHYDHLMDVPVIARRDGAVVIGSESTAHVLRAAGHPEDRLRVLGPDGGTVEAGDFRVTLVRSRHGRIAFGREPYPGPIPPGAFPLPGKTKDFRMGDVYGLLVEAAGISLYHTGSAELVEEAVPNCAVDVLIPGVAGAKNRPGYVERLVAMLRPKAIVPTHYDAFFQPLAAGLKTMFAADLPAFFAELERHAPDAAVVMPDLLEAVTIAPGGAIAKAG